jgi:hypothetical protein
MYTTAFDSGITHFDLQQITKTPDQSGTTRSGVLFFFPVSEKL